MAFLNTVKYALRYPNLAQAADLADIVQKLAEDVDGKMVGYIFDVIGARPAAGVPGRRFFATDTRVEYIDSGAVWYPVYHYRGVMNVTDFLASTGWVDGEEADISVNAANGDVWRVKYFASILDVNKWVVIGANPLEAIDDALVTTNSSAFVDLGGGTPAHVVGISGVYDTRVFADLNSNGGANAIVGFKNGAAAAVQMLVAGVTTNSVLGSYSKDRTAILTRTNTIKLQYASSSGGVNASFSLRGLYITPRRLSQA